MAAAFCSELFSLLRNGSERPESLHLFLFHGTEFRVVHSSAEGFGTEFRVFTGKNLKIKQTSLPRSGVGRKVSAVL
jgi:hypothetical protein